MSQARKRHRRQESGSAGRLAGHSLALVKTSLRCDPAEWTDERHKRGLAGEQQAIPYLLSRGWHIVAHRFRVGHSDIDLIVRQGSLVAFVVVKARRGDAFGSPLEAVTRAKRQELGQADRGLGDR